MIKSLNYSNFFYEWIHCFHSRQQTATDRELALQRVLQIEKSGNILIFFIKNLLIELIIAFIPAENQLNTKFNSIRTNCRTIHICVPLVCDTKMTLLFSVKQKMKEIKESRWLMVYRWKGKAIWIPCENPSAGASFHRMQGSSHILQWNSSDFRTKNILMFCLFLNSNLQVNPIKHSRELPTWTGEKCDQRTERQSRYICYDGKRATW